MEMVTTTKSLHSLSNRDLWTALWRERRQRSDASTLDELHAEWWRRIEELRGKPRRKGWSARGLQRAELFRRATEAYFDGMEDAVAQMEAERGCGCGENRSMPVTKAASPQLMSLETA